MSIAHSGTECKQILTNYSKNFGSIDPIAASSLNLRMELSSFDGVNQIFSQGQSQNAYNFHLIEHLPAQLATLW